MNVQRIKCHAPQFLNNRAKFRLLDKRARRWLDWVAQSLRLVTRQRVPWLERVWQRPFHPASEQRIVHQWQPTVNVFWKTAVAHHASHHAGRATPGRVTRHRHLHHHQETVQTFQAAPATTTHFLTKPVYHNRWLIDAGRSIHRTGKPGRPVANHPPAHLMLAHKKVTFLYQPADRQPGAENQAQTKRFIQQRIQNRQRQETQRGQYYKQMSPLFAWKRPVPAEQKTPENFGQSQNQAPMQQAWPAAQAGGQAKATLSQPELVQLTDQVMQQIDRRLVIWRERNGRA